MTKQHIIDEIKRTAKANGGEPLGVRRFLTETGIKESDWKGRFWMSIEVRMSGPLQTTNSHTVHRQKQYLP